MIIDAHVHIFTRWQGIMNGQPATSTEYGKIMVGSESMFVMPPSYEKSASMIDVYRANMEDAGIDKAVLLSNMGYGYHNDLQKQIIQSDPETFKAIALTDITKGEKAAKELEYLMTKEGFSGLKIETLTCFQCTEDYAIDDPCIIPTWECLNDLGGIVMLHLSRPYDIDTLDKIANRYDRIKYVMCHFGAELTIRETSRPGNWDKLKKMVAEHDGMYLETSSIGFNLKEDFGFTRTCALIEEAYREVGGDKIIWGTDYPSTLLFSAYRELRDIVQKGCKNIPEDDKKKIMGKSAYKLFWN